MTSLGSLSSNSNENIVELVAGNGTSGLSGDDSFAVQLNAPRGVTVNPAREVFIADTGNHRIRRLVQGKLITTVAGIGISGFSGDGALGPKAKLDTPQKTALDAAGNLFIADTANHRIRKVDTAEWEIIGVTSCMF